VKSAKAIIWKGEKMEFKNYTMNKTQIISLKVMLLFTIAIFSTFIGDYLHDFFGDWKCEGSGERLEGFFNRYDKCNYGDCGFHEPKWHWGYRHWLYLAMCIVLFFIQVIDIINYAEKPFKK
jgi:hypothetical protein